MNALATEEVEYSDPAPILVAATSGSAFYRAQQTIAAAGGRAPANVAIEHLADRLRDQTAASALWIELDRDWDGESDQQLRRALQEAARRGYRAVIAAPLSLVDPVMSFVEDSAADILIEASDIERTAALAMATSAAKLPLTLCDVTRDQSAERLRHLSDEVNRIAATLARLSLAPGPAAPKPVSMTEQDLPPISVGTVREVIRLRRLRSRFFDDGLFADPAWDMMLDLLQAEIGQLRVPVSSLCIAAAVPATTALRWLKKMVSDGLFVRRPDVQDGRRVWVELSPPTSAALRSYFAEAGKAAAI
jgi:hypothetical protein